MNNIAKYCRDYLTDRGAAVTVAHKQQFKFINLEITSACNLACFSCNQYCDSAPTKERMTLGQIRRFLAESREMRWPWEEVLLMGGEPTLHPDFDDIALEVLKLNNYLPNVRLKVTTNGMGKRAQAGVIAARRLGYEVNIGSFPLDKRPGTNVVPEFGNTLLAPVDMGIKDIRSCQIHGTCGMALTRWGYLPCPCGGARVLGLDIFASRLEDVTEEWAADGIRQLCGTCGRNLNYCQLVRDNDGVSPFWEAMLARYKADGPFDLPLYGEI